jgi:thiol-disulfide isomerase/thioredoxin
MNKPVLVLVMSQVCGACQNFKKKMLPDLEKELRNDPRIRFISLEFAEMGISKDGKDKDGKDYHPDLKNGFVEFFPTLLLFPGNLWNNKESKLKGVPKHDMKKNPQIDYSKNSILNWVENTIKSDPLFSSSDKFMLTENGKPINSYPKQLENGRYIVPTYGNRFKPTRVEDEL